MELNINENENSLVKKVLIQRLYEDREIAKKNRKDINKLQEDIASARLELECALSNFNSVSEPELVDLFIYQIKSAQSRYDILLKRVREKEKEIKTTKNKAV